jgi:DNA-directed RNA polymerase subunit D
MKIQVLKKDEHNTVFKISEINPSIANTIRRYVLAHVPTMAVDEIEVRKNGSALYDEMLALRLGLVPIKTDLKSYKFWEENQNDRPKSAQYELKLTLKAKGPCTVYASDIKSQDPKIKPVFDKMPIIKLLESQELDLTLTARLGKGKEHAKFSPGLIVYRGIPKIKTTKDSNIKECLEKLSEILEKKGNNIEIKDITKWNESHENICEMNGIEVESSKEEFIFKVESWGQLTPKEMISTATDLFDKKLSEFETLIKKVK